MVPVAFVRAPYACNGTLDYIINGRESYARDIKPAAPAVNPETPLRVIDVAPCA